MKSIAKFLKEIIDDHGMEYLHKKPYEVYCGLIDKGAAEAYARLVMVTLMAGASVKAVQADANDLSEHIQRECFVVKVELSIFVQSLNPQNYAASVNGCSKRLL